MKLMTTRQGDDGLEAHISNAFLFALVFVIFVIIVTTELWPPEVEPDEVKICSK